VDTSIVLTLRENPPEVMKDAAEILIKLIGNVIRDPVKKTFIEEHLNLKLLFHEHHSLPYTFILFIVVFKGYLYLIYKI
jgi:hypothetical protein